MSRRDWDALEAQLAADRADVERWARELLATSDWCILDTETTGLDDEAEAIQIAVVRPDGEAALDTLVRPVRAIPEDVTYIHGITNEHVASAPALPEVWPGLLAATAGRKVIAYNASFDRRILRQSAERHGLAGLYGYRWDNATQPDGSVRCTQVHDADWHCAMERYAAWYGHWSEYHGSYRWQRLPVAEGVTGHTAIGDCRSVLALIKRMAGVA